MKKRKRSIPELKQFHNRPSSAMTGATSEILMDDKLSNDQVSKYVLHCASHPRPVKIIQSYEDLSVRHKC